MQLRSPEDIVVLLRQASEEYAEAERQVLCGGLDPDLARSLKLEAMLHALGAARDAAALLTQDVPNAVLEPLDRLFGALTLLCSGRPAAALRPVKEPKTGSKPKDGATELLVKAMIVAAALTLVQAPGRPRMRVGEADRWVSERASALVIWGPHGKAISPHMVRDWRTTYKSNAFLLSAVEMKLAASPPASIDAAKEQVEVLLQGALRAQSL